MRWFDSALRTVHELRNHALEDSGREVDGAETKLRRRGSHAAHQLRDACDIERAGPGRLVDRLVALVHGRAKHAHVGVNRAASTQAGHSGFMHTGVGCAWDVRGMCVGCAWDVRGMCVGCIAQRASAAHCRQVLKCLGLWVFRFKQLRSVSACAAVKPGNFSMIAPIIMILARVMFPASVCSLIAADGQGRTEPCEVASCGMGASLLRSVRRALTLKLGASALNVNLPRRNVRRNTGGGEDEVEAGVQNTRPLGEDGRVDRDEHHDLQEVHRGRVGHDAVREAGRCWMLCERRAIEGWRRESGPRFATLGLDMAGFILCRTPRRVPGGARKEPRRAVSRTRFHSPNQTYVDCRRLLCVAA